jgi:hypothetical protein
MRVINVMNIFYYNIISFKFQESLQIIEFNQTHFRYKDILHSIRPDTINMKQIQYRYNAL